jgi:hypothetical protein
MRFAHEFIRLISAIKTFLVAKLCGPKTKEDLTDYPPEARRADAAHYLFTKTEQAGALRANPEARARMLTPLEEWPVTKPESAEPPILQRKMGQNMTLCQLKEKLLEPHVTFGARNV